MKIQKIQKVKDTNLVLRVTLLLNWKAHTICTNFGPSMNYKRVKEANLDITTLIWKDVNNNSEHSL